MRSSRRGASLAVVVALHGAVLAAAAPAATAAPTAAATTWTFQQPALPVVPNGEFTDVDCPNAIACVAVGSYAKAGAVTPLVERWDGTAWTLVDLPVPAGRDASAAAVSCASATACVVVGSAFTDTVDNAESAFVARLAGRTWTSRVLPDPSADLHGRLTDVSCASASSCLAVGAGVGFADEMSFAVPAAYRLTGATWALSTPVRTGGGLRGVSCPITDWCTAVGPDGGQGSVRQVLTAGAWKVRPLADTGTDDVSLDAVSCTSPGDCAAVGRRSAAGDGFHGKPAVETSIGGSWSLAAVDPTVAGSTGSLADVDCVSATRCTAVGRLGEPTGTSAPVALRSGTTWTKQAVSVDTSDLRGVACLASSPCVAVGSVDGRVENEESLGEGLPVAVRASGSGAFSELAAVTPQGFTSGQFTSVSCYHAGFCTAVGFARDRFFRPFAFVDRLTDTGWVRQSLPDLGANSELLGVSCGRDAACVAVGRTGEEPDLRPIVLSWNGANWSTTAVSGVTATTVGQFTAVSCMSREFCLVVGRTADVDATPLTARLNGSSWALTPPVPVTGQDVQLSGVSCPSVTRCGVVGSARGADGSWRGVDLGWSGSTWTTNSTPPPLGTLGCYSSTSCVASAARPDRGAPVVYRYVPSAWRTEPLPNPASLFGVDVRSTACEALEVCVAVGNASDGDTHGFYIARRSTTGTWSRDRVATSDARASDTFFGVDCTDAATCIAVGQGPTQPVIAVTPTA